jgi:arylsulfatase A-like enzyme
VQTIDLPRTLLDFFQIPAPDQMQGESIAPVLKDNGTIREAGIFGIFGGHVNVTDGRYVYMRGPVLRVPGEGVGLAHQFGTMLFDTQTDPKQVHPIKDSEIEARMIELLREQMRLAHAPAEQYERLGL